MGQSPWNELERNPGCRIGSCDRSVFCVLLIIMEGSGEKRPKPRGAGNFGATPVRAAQKRIVLAEPTGIIISQIHHSCTDSRVRVLNDLRRSGLSAPVLFGTCHHISQGGAAPEGRPAAFMPAPVTRTTFLESSLSLQRQPASAIASW